MRPTTRFGVAILLIAVAATFAVGEKYDVGVHKSIREKLDAFGSTDAVITFRKDANLSKMSSALPDDLTREDMRWNVYHFLTSHRDEQQRRVLNYLEGENVEFESFWIANVITVGNISKTVLNGAIKCCRKDIKSVVPATNLKRVVPKKLQNDAGKSSVTLAWNIEKINADKCWAKGKNGTGVVVATLDGGVRYTHESLVHGYRGHNEDGSFSHDYNWNDWAYQNKVPFDSEGHGTNVQGIATGSFSSGIGVAPGAKWISGKIFNYAGYSATKWTLGGCQWVMCPSPVNQPGKSENCSLGADVVSCSWGEDDATEPYLKKIVSAWLKGGIVPVFAVGNSGPQCGTSVSPSDYSGVVGVGATSSSDDILGFSSRGPAAINGSGVRFQKQAAVSDLPYTELAPAIVAPGFDIQGPSYKDDNGYSGMSGTSQAAPHVAGVAAILLSENSKLTPMDVRKALYSGASTESLQDPDTGSDHCGGVPWNKFPNYVYGWGRLDCEGALASLES
eukprot:g1026.t1